MFTYLAVGGALIAVGLLIWGIVKLVVCLVEAVQRCGGRKIEPEPDGESSSSSASHTDVGQEPSTQTNDDNSRPTDVIVDRTDDASPGPLPGEKIRMAFKPRTTT